MPTPVRSILIRLLEIDRPVPQRSAEEIAAEVERNYRWNFAVNLLDGAFFWPGYAFLSSATILPLFVSKLAPGPFAVGLLAVVAQASWFLPQLFTANATERLPRKKAAVVNLGLFLERLPVWLMVLAALAAVRAPLVALVLFLLAYAWHGFGAGALGPAWQDLIARIFPVDRRGRFFGITMFVGAAAGTAGAALSTWLLKTYAFPMNFVYCFAIAAGMISISWCFIALAREPAQPGKATRESTREYLGSLPDLLRRDHNYRRFLIARSLMALGGMGYGFLTVAAVRRWAIPDSTAGLYTGAYLIGQTVGNLAFGLLADRHGHKLSLELGALVAMAGYGMAWLAPSSAWYFPVFFLLGIVSAAMIVSGILVVLEFCGADRRPTYVGIANTAVGLVNVVAPLLGAALAIASYGWLFAFGAVINLSAFVLMRWWVREPRWADLSETGAS